jgi:ABC-type transporter Mla subunit MlaD
MKASSNNFVAGVFTLAGVAGLVFIILTLSGASALTHPRTKYVVRFTLVDGARGLKNGSDVSVGGQSVGQVKKVEFEKDAQTGAPTGILVDMAIDKQTVLYKNATVYQLKPLLGDVSAIDIPNVGSPPAPRLEPGGMVDGSVAPPSFLQQAGWGDKQRTQLQGVMDSVERSSKNIEDVTATVKTHADPTFKAVNDTAADIRSVAGDVKTRINEWSPMVTSTLKNADQLSSSLLATGKLLDEGLEKAKAFISDVQALLRDNGPRVTSTLKNTDELTTKLNTELYAQVQATMTDAQNGLREFARAGQSISTFIAEQAPELRLTMANARLASDQLKLTMTEVRRNPWRLLYQPGKKELERELLYDAARDYATAVSDLHAASASLESVSAAAGATGGQIPADRLAEIQKAMQESFARYKEAEGKFLDLVVKEGK